MSRRLTPNVRTRYHACMDALHADTLGDVPKKITSFRLSGGALRIVDAVAAHNGSSRTAALELVLRQFARDYPERLRSTLPPEVTEGGK